TTVKQPFAGLKTTRDRPSGPVPSDSAESHAPAPPEIALAPSKFADIYNEHSRAIYYLALRFLGDPQKAEDATHDVFLKAFRKMDHFREEASWPTCLYRITINHCRNIQHSWHERHMSSNPADAVGEATAAPT